MMLAALLFTRLAGAEDFVDRVNRLRPSVVKLEGRDWLGNARGSGTGFFISGDGLLATNEHVAALAPETAILADGTRRAVLGVLVQDEDSDLAVLRVEGDGYTPLLLGSTEGMARGEGIAVIGSPLGVEQVVTEGIVAGLMPQGYPDRQHGDAVAMGPLVQVSAEISPGSSGSPVIDGAARVVAVVQSGSAFGGHIAVDAVQLHALLARAPVSGELQALNSPTRQALHAGLVATALVVLSLGWAWISARRERAARGAARRGR